MDFEQQQDNEERRRFEEDHDAICDCGDVSTHDLLKADPAYEIWAEEVEKKEVTDAEIRREVGELVNSQQNVIDAFQELTRVLNSRRGLL
tara:strand:- start:4929 stop:5198 length:270 start_codon:yes stop_codon:yes gene_type:complete